MENLTILEQEALEILKQLERCCERVELHNSKYAKEEKNLTLMINDLDFSVLKRGENIHDVEKYLQKIGVDFHITFDLENDIPDMYIDREHPTEDFIELGIVKGENILTTQARIKELIHELNIKNDTQPKKKLDIKYNTGIGKLIFNEDGVAELTGKQKDVIDCLTEAGIDTKVSWDEIHEKIEDDINLDLNKHEIILAKKSVNGAVSEINKKAERYLGVEKPLIGFKENEYWIQYEISTDG